MTKDVPLSRESHDHTCALRALTWVHKCVGIDGLLGCLYTVKKDSESLHHDGRLPLRKRLMVFKRTLKNYTNSHLVVLNLTFSQRINNQRASDVTPCHQVSRVRVSFD